MGAARRYAGRAHGALDVGRRRRAVLGHSARRTDARVNVRTPFNLFPLMTGRLPEHVTRRLVEHLTDEKEFWSRYPLPTVALNDPKFDPLTMWRGPTWVNVNYLLIEGLQRTGYVDLAA